MVKDVQTSKEDMARSGELDIGSDHVKNRRRVYMSLCMNVIEASSSSSLPTPVGKQHDV